MLRLIKIRLRRVLRRLDLLVDFNNLKEVLLRRIGFVQRHWLDDNVWQQSRAFSLRTGRELLKQL